MPVRPSCWWWSSISPKGIFKGKYYEVDQVRPRGACLPACLSDVVPGCLLVTSTSR